MLKPLADPEFLARGADVSSLGDHVTCLLSRHVTQDKIWDT